MKVASHLIYVILGGAMTAVLVRSMLNVSLPWLLLLVPMTLVALFLAVMGIVNVWLFWTGGDASLNPQRAFWLYVRCWMVAAMGIALGITFTWLHSLVSSEVTHIVPWLGPVVIGSCVVLTLAAMLSIMRGQTLHEARLVNAENENQLLKAQLNPHFLYNTLNNIDALVWVDQQKASSAITELSTLMRYLTYSARKERVSVGEEAACLRQLVELQRLRLPRHDVLSLHIDVVDASLPVAPLLLMPIVENTFKHCGTLDQPNAIVINLAQHGSCLTLTTSNVMPDVVPAGRSGIGLQVLRRRLALLYPSSHTLQTDIDDNGRYVAMLKLTLSQ